MTRTELVDAMARAARDDWRDRNSLRGGTLDWPDIDDDERDEALDATTAALTALCAALRIPPAALDALAAGEAVVAPMVATDAQALGAFERDMGPDDDLYLSIYRAMVAASPYAPEAKA